MLERIYKHDGNKTALAYKGVFLSFDLLLKRLETQKEAAFYSIQNDPLETIINYLAAEKYNKPFLAFDAKEDLPLPSNHCIGISTGGTRNGQGKIIWKTKENWEEAFPFQSEIFGVQKDAVLFVVDALKYSANLNAVIHGLWAGATVVLDSISSVGNWHKIHKEHHVNAAFLVPSHWDMFLKTVEKATYLKNVFTAGEKLELPLAKRLICSLPNARITEYYGAAELGHVSYQQDKDIVYFPYSVGVPFPKVEITLKEEVVHVESPFAAVGYSTANDLGYLKNGRLYLTGRGGRVFNKRGLNIYAQEIEQLVNTLPLVKQCVLMQNEVGKLVLYVESRASCPKSVIWNLLEKKLAKEKHPHFIQLLAELPRTDIGKMDYAEISRIPEVYF